MQHLIRKNILELKPYSSARDEFKGEASIFLDANENSLGSPTPTPFNRYPDPRQKRLKSILSDIKQVHPDQIFLGNGSDEAIDLLFRIFCEPGRDNVVVLPPTYGMYSVQAAIHGTPVREVPLTRNFQADPEAILRVCDENTKLLFLCSPNNPTGNLIALDAIHFLAQHFGGILVVDEAYIDFADQASCTTLLEQYPRMVILQTLSKAWGLAGLRLGMAIAHPEVIAYFNKVKYPYNIGSATLQLVEGALGNFEVYNTFLNQLKTDKKILEKEIKTLEFVSEIFPSDANFILIRVQDAQKTYDFLAGHGVIVRNRSKDMHCENCLRITVGTTAENERLLELLRKFALEI